MEMLFAVVLLVAGFVFLIKGADFFVEGSSAIARKFHVPPLIIGMTIVAMGTSLPELSVSVSASMNGNNALAVSNAVGSNLFNLMVVLGASAVLSSLAVSDDVLRRDFPFSILCAVLLLGLGYFGMELGRMDGAVLFGAFVGFLVYMVRSALQARKAMAAGSMDGGTGEGVDSSGDLAAVDRSGAVDGGSSDDTAGELSILRCIIYIIGGAAAIKFGGDWVVSGASTIALGIGISENLVGLTIVAFGTSLPELVTSLVAAKKNELDMAVGNVVGSNVFNILMILGVAALVSPIAFIGENVIDIVVLIGFSVMCWGFCLSKKCLSRLEGFVMLAMYAVYVVYICVR